MSKILVTGANGFLGDAVVSLLNQTKQKFVCATRKHYSNNQIICDLSKPQQIIEMLRKIKPEIIINLAASADFQADGQKLLFPVNSLLPSLLANFCFENNAHLIHTSGIIVHGFQHRRYNKHIELLPDTEYGKSKLIADMNISSSECKASILRFGGIFGNNGPKHLGINNAIQNAMRGNVPILYGTGKAKRNYIYVNDAAKAIVKCIDEDLEGTYYLGGEIKTIDSMLNDICEILIPGSMLLRKKGKETIDQIVDNNLLIETTSFKNALKQLR